jgi:hypothetical protein
MSQLRTAQFKLSQELKTQIAAKYTYKLFQKLESHRAYSRKAKGESARLKSSEV